MLDYRIRVFQEVAELKNITGAARRLNISQPAVSKHIRQLEEYFGVTLLTRSATGISLTDAGYILFDHALQVGDIQDSVLEKLGQSKGVLRGTLRVGASTTISQYYLPPYLTRFLNQNPQVKLSLLNGNSEEIIGAMLSRKIDVGLTEGASRRRDLKATRFFEDEIICIASKDHPAAQHESIPLSILKNQQFILREKGSGTREVVEQSLRKAGLKMEKMMVAAEISSSETIKGILAGGFGISFLSRLCVKRELEDESLREIKIEKLKITRSFLALFPQGPFPGGLVGVFLKGLSPQITT